MDSVTDSREWLHVTLSCIGDGVITTDRHGHVTFLNPVAQQLTGWTQEQAVSHPLEHVFRIVNEDTRQEVDNPALRALREGAIVGLANHTLLISRDGAERPIDDSAAPIRNDKGELAGAVLVFRDITERKEHERTIQGALDFAVNILATLRHAFLVLDKDLHVVSANRSFYRRFQVAPETTLGHLVYDLGNGQWNIPGLRKLLEELLPQNHSFEDFEVEHEFSGIGRRYMALNARRVHKPGNHSELILLVIEDITERKQGGALIQIQSDSLELVVKGEPIEEILLFLARSMESQSQGRFLVAIHLMEADGFHFGFVAAPSLPARYAEATKGMDARLELGCCSSAVMSHTPTVVPDFVDAVPKKRWPQFTAEMLSLGLRGCFTTPILSPDKRVLGTFAIYYQKPGDPSPEDRLLVDFVTNTVGLAIERKQNEAALRQSEERFRMLSDNIPQLAWIADAGTDGKVYWFNKSWLDYTGATLEQMQGSGWQRVHHPDHAERVIQKFQHHVREGLDWEDNFPLRGKDGTYRWFLSRMNCLRDESGRVVRIFGTNTDVTELRAAQESMRASEERSRALFTSSPVAIFACDRDAVIQSYNARAAELWGREPERGVEKHCGSVRLWLPDGTRLPHDQSPMMDVLRTGRPANSVECTIERPDGSRIPVIVNFAPLLDSQGEVVGAVTSFDDISELKKAEQDLRDSEVRYRRLFESAKDGVLILDAHTGKIIDANAFMLALMGLDGGEILGKELFEIGMFGDESESRAAFRELQEKRYLRYEHLPLQNRRGEKVEVEVVANVYAEDHTLVAQCNVRDISARVRMETQIAEQTAAIASESRRKDEFLAMLSHELRNPLAPIRSAVHLLRLQERGSENLIQQQAREIIERQVSNLTKLVSDLLEVSRVVSGRVRLEKQVVDLNQVLQHAIQTVTGLIEQRKHKLVIDQCPDPVWVNADALRMEEVFVNLLSNAAKYTPDGGTIEVHCTRPQGANHAQVQVRDTGVGIEPQLLPRIFDLFTQAERSLDRAAGGLGIGLSLAHRLVDMHGGAIEAKSPPEGRTQGSEFIVRLALVPAPEQPLPPAAVADTPQRPDGHRVLVVDDNIDQVIMLSSLLRHAGYSVQSAYTGPEGLKTALQWRPDTVLLDIGLPGLDGYEVARRLRADPALGNMGGTMRLLALTGYGRDADIALAREAGFDAHLVKPCDLDALEKLIAASHNQATQDRRVK